MIEASLQAVMREGLNRYSGSHRLSPRESQVCHHILDCRTEALGGLRLDCDHCDQALPHYYACRDRHCPRCQRRASQTWCERQRAAVLPVTYHHLVVTLPHSLNPWIRLHPEVIYALLFETVWATLSAFGADPKRLGGQLGMTAVLHTWGQTLSQHVHLHCLVPGGAFSAQGHWHPARSTYLFPVRALARHIRGGFVSRLRRHLEDGELPRIENPARIGALLDTLMAADWVVYSKPCLTHTETVVDYLARYSHRIALTDARILSLDDDQVQLDYKDYRDGSRHKVLTLAGEELIRRFLMHVLPKGFMRIRHFGFLANRCRAERLEEIRAAIDVAQPQLGQTADAESPFNGYPCPLCRKGRLQITAYLTPKRFNGG
jgi:Putative transposase/Transposase zinc-binding domain